MVRPVFIVGVGRSGTSLLQSMFAAHPDIDYLPETGFIRRYVANSHLDSLYKRSGKNAVIDKLNSDEAFLRSGFNAEELLDNALHGHGQLDHLIYNQMIGQKGKYRTDWVGDKDPRLIEFLPLIKKLYNNSVVINIIRDPRDVLVSKKKAAWSREGHIWKHIFANRVQLRLGRKLGPLCFPSNYYELSYEALIDNPEKVLLDLCEKIGVPFNSCMLHYGDAAKKLVSEKEVSWKRETLGPVLHDNKYKWKDQLLPREIFLAQSCCPEAINFSKGEMIKWSKLFQLNVRDVFWVVVGTLLIFSADFPYKAYRNIKTALTCKKI